jgi:cell division protein FtsW
MAEQQHTEQKSFSERFFGGDRVLWIIIAILAVTSLLVVYSSTASMAWRKMGGDTSHYFFNQLSYMLLGFGVMYVVHRVNYQVYMRLAWVLFLFALLFMCMTFFFGAKLNDAQRWIRIPGVGLTFQPSDFLRVTLVMVLAQQLAVRQGVIDKIPILPRLFVTGAGAGRSRTRRRQQTNSEIFMQTTLPLLLPVVLACGTIFFSNFSTSAIAFITCFIMLFIGRVRMGELWRLLLTAALAVALAVAVMNAFNIGRSATWTNRITSFVSIGESRIDPGEDYQKEQARIAIASGGLIGKGPGRSTQRANLPHSYSDFAYAFIVEEYGIVGATFVLALYLWIFFRSMVIFRRCGTAFPSLLVLGLGLMIVLQAIVNMLVSVGLTPVTGQTLPLVSLGGSSVIFTAMALGMMLGVSRQMNEQTIDKPKEESLLER